MVMDEIKTQLEQLPDGPGCYLYRSAAGEVLYVGKAKSLRQRVRSYFQPSRNLEARILSMINQVRKIEHISTGSEIEALILESNLIKQHRPRYNILLRDDKHYPYVRVDLNEAYPRPAIVRQIKKDGARYFGPYTDADAIRETLRTVRRIFPFRTCTDYKIRTVARPCLDYHIRRCLGPCRLLLAEAAVSHKPGGQSRHGRDAVPLDESERAAVLSEYRAMMKEFCLFLEGRQGDVVDRLKMRMEGAAENLDFEKAAELRDQIAAATKITEKQHMISAGLEDRDVIGLARDYNEAYAQVFNIRSGKVVGREYFVLTGVAGESDESVLAAFLQQYYSVAATIPPAVLLPTEPEGVEVLAEYASGLRGSRVRLEIPRRGDRKALVELAQKNAAESRDEHIAARNRELEATGEAVSDLAERLGLPGLPNRIECYDISNIQGQEAVGSMVVFEHGKPRSSEYRRFKIEDVEGANDFAMMQEVLRRRFRRRAQTAGTGGFGATPDLLIVDGGKGQVNAAAEVLAQFGMEPVPLYGLAKEFEHLFAPHRSDPIILPQDSKAIHLLQHIRDEAHRFAVGYHRNLRTKRTLKSALDDIPGIGPARRTALLRKFGSVARMRLASVNDLAQVPGIHRALAEEILEHFGRAPGPRRRPGDDGPPSAGGEPGSGGTEFGRDGGGEG